MTFIGEGSGINSQQQDTSIHLTGNATALVIFRRLG
jgi:hypothetical protein